MKKIKGYKAFNKDMTCNGFKYEEGKTYKKDKVIICQEGFHFCENPLDTLNYYDLCDSIFHEVESIGKIDKNKGDSKIATTQIKIGAKLNLEGFIKASINFVFKYCKINKNNYANQASSGDNANQASSGYNVNQASSGYNVKQASSGYNVKQASSGDNAKSEINGKYSVSASIGMDSKIKGKKGNWITLAEWIWNKEKQRYIPIYVKSAQIDGEKIKEDTWYMLKDGKFKVVT